MYETINFQASELTRQLCVEPIDQNSVDMRKRPCNVQRNEKTQGEVLKTCGHKGEVKTRKNEKDKETMNQT
jgi:hypothetical protein